MPTKLLEATMIIPVLIMNASDNAGSPFLFRMALSATDKNKVSRVPIINNKTKAAPNSKLVPKPRPNNTTLYVSKPFCTCSFPKPSASATISATTNAANPHTPVNGVKNETSKMSNANTLLVEKKSIP